MFYNKLKKNMLEISTRIYKQDKKITLIGGKHEVQNIENDVFER